MFYLLANSFGGGAVARDVALVGGWGRRILQLRGAMGLVAQTIATGRRCNVLEGLLAHAHMRDLCVQVEGCVRIHLAGSKTFTPLGLKRSGFSSPEKFFVQKGPRSCFQCSASGIEKRTFIFSSTARSYKKSKRFILLVSQTDRKRERSCLIGFAGR